MEQNNNSGSPTGFINMIETTGIPLDHEIVICSASVTSNESSGLLPRLWAVADVICRICYRAESAWIKAKLCTFSAPSWWVLKWCSTICSYVVTESTAVLPARTWWLQSATSWSHHARHLLLCQKALVLTLATLCACASAGSQLQEKLVCSTKPECRCDGARLNISACLFFILLPAVSFHAGGRLWLTRGASLRVSRLCG